MPAISNTSPLLNLSIIDHLFLLPQQFEQVYIPMAVLTELKLDEPRPGSVYLQDAIKEGWLVLHPVNNTPLICLDSCQLFTMSAIPTD